MIKVLAYCAFLHRVGIAGPERGVNGAKVQDTCQNEAEDDLRLLWSEVEWPFADSSLQRSAVEFHEVISHVFAQTTVVPFRLLSLFDDQQSLRNFLAANRAGFIADLKRLQNLVQMECILYPEPPPQHAKHHPALPPRHEQKRLMSGTPVLGTPAPEPVGSTSGRNYLEQKAALLHRTEDFIQDMNTALGPLSKEVRIRESKKATRIFVLVERGNEQGFHSIVRQLPVPERLARRTSGPWPPAEFLSDSLKNR